jgi:hypothetical protein
MSKIKDTAIPVDYIRECFALTESGDVVWIDRPDSHFKKKSSMVTYRLHMVGKSVKSKCGKGYVSAMLRYNGQVYRVGCHRIIWVLTHGKWPDGVIDHINRVRDDNRIENLRDVSVGENARNNGNSRGTGLFGSYPRRGKFIAQVMVNKKARYLGSFNTPQEAHQRAVEFRNGE